MTGTASQDVMPPFWLSPASWFQPAHYVGSAWLTHAPFAAWLVDQLRPRHVVELGSHRGYSAFMFSEAAKRLGHAMTFSALDSWEGDDQAGFYDDRVYQRVSGVAERDYPDTLRLVRGWFTDSRPQFEDASAELLHIDGRHGYEDVKRDYEEWVSVVSPNGVVIMHDIAEHQEGFGVHRFWDQLVAEHPTFAFRHGHGLGVVAPHGIPDGPVGRLFSVDEADAERIRADYSALGDAIGHNWELRKLPKVTSDLETKVAALEQRVADLQSSTSWRVTGPLRSLGRLTRR